jgi:hypothetical protein
MRRLLVLAIVSVIIVPIIGIWLAIDDFPVVQEATAPEAEDAYRTKRLAKRAFHRIATTTGPGELAFTEQELNGLAALAARAVPGLRGRVNITQWGLESAASVPIPAHLIDGYVNVRAGLEPSPRGISFSHLSIGSINVPGPFAISAMRVLGNLALGESRGSLIIDMVEGVELQDRRVVIRIDVPPDLRVALEDAGDRFKSVRDVVGLAGDPKAIGIYYDRIEALDGRLDAAARKTLASYMGPLFSLARERSRNNDPVVENESLIYAMATYFGSYRFGTLTGMKRTARVPGVRARKGSPGLAGRRDLRLHFLISAGLELLSNHDVSIAIGEFKELLDTEKGGTGFSFTDLAADRAGVRFAQVATESFGSARRLQDALADSRSEAAFFPPISGLQDGLSQLELKQIYGGIDGVDYRKTVAGIDIRIAALPAYRR